MLDYSAQELRFAAFQSGDAALRTMTEAGDPYFELAETAQLTREGDTPETNPDARETGKVISLAMLYGAGSGLLVSKGLDEQLARGHPDSAATQICAILPLVGHVGASRAPGKTLSTRLGWQLRIRPVPTFPLPIAPGVTFRCKPVGAEIMRLVMIRARSEASRHPASRRIHDRRAGLQNRAPRPRI